MSQQLIDFSEPQPYVKRLLRYVRSGELLDLGAGWGRNTRFFATRGFTVTAVERDADAVTKLRRNCTGFKTNVRVRRADVRAWQVEPDRYDAIICTMTLHFLADEREVAAVLHNVQRSTTTGGVNIISLYTNRNPSGTRPYLIAPGRLPIYYGNWTILEHYEGLGRWYHDAAGPRRDYVERITAQRPAFASER